MLYWKASNYLFTGSWPLAFGEEAIERSVTAANPFKSGVEANPAWSSQYFNVSFNNGTATAQLPGLFVTPDGSRPLPTVILTTGTDFTKEETFLQFGLEALARGYAVLAYDGPGQGAVLKNDPHMPFYADWGPVLGVILNYVEDDLANFVQLDKIAQCVSGRVPGNKGLRRQQRQAGSLRAKPSTVLGHPSLREILPGAGAGRVRTPPVCGPD